MLYEIARACLFKMDPETAHGLIMGNIDWAVALGLTKLVTGPDVSHPVKVMGLTFPNAVGLAAGMDKQAAHVSSIGALGFGHIEVGTLTPKPQPGNPKPRLWRLIPAQGIVNYMGFNNVGVEKGLQNLRQSAVKYRQKGGIVGVNIGKQTVTPLENALDDYRILMQKAYNDADYLAIDISCPNTTNLTRLQDDDYLYALTQGIADERKALEDKHGKYVPITVKIGPDLTDDAVRASADVFVKCGMDAVTATNTTRSRKGVEHLPKSKNPGGLSGLPLFEQSTHVVQVLSDHLKGELPIIASGGVMSAELAVEKMKAGASLVQIYSGFIYRGPVLISEAAQAIKDWSATQK